MKLFVEMARDLACDLARDLAVVTIVLAVICAAGWMVFGRQGPESNSKAAPPDERSIL